MTMVAIKPLPTPEALVRLVSFVTETMLGVACTALSGPALRDRLGALTWRVAFLPIPGARPLAVALSSDEAGCRDLGAALFDCAPERVDGDMMEDALCELVNMIGGQVRGAVRNDHALGLPRIDQGPAVLPDPNVGTLFSRCIVVKAGSVELVVRVMETRT
jgi:hypothetical protein